MPTPQETETRVRDMLAAWDRRDLDAFLAFLAPDVYWHDLGMPYPPALGRRAVREFCQTLLAAFPDFRFVIRAPLCLAADGLSCVVPWTIDATNTGVLEPLGAAPTNRKVHFDGFDYIQFTDGLVSRIETRFDPAVVIEQLLDVRLRPVRGSLRERLLVLLQRIRAAWLRRRFRRLSRPAAA